MPAGLPRYEKAGSSTAKIVRKLTIFSARNDKVGLVDFLFADG
jgi:hypothetical protein